MKRKGSHALEIVLFLSYWLLVKVKHTHRVSRTLPLSLSGFLAFLSFQWNCTYLK